MRNPSALDHPRYPHSLSIHREEIPIHQRRYLERFCSDFDGGLHKMEWESIGNLINDHEVRLTKLVIVLDVRLPDISLIFSIARINERAAILHCHSDDCTHMRMKVPSIISLAHTEYYSQIKMEYIDINDANHIKKYDSLLVKDETAYRVGVFTLFRH